MGIVHSYENSSFKLDIPLEKAYMYYTDDIHFDRVSLSDPNNRFVKKPHTHKFSRRNSYFDVLANIKKFILLNVKKIDNYFFTK